MLLVVEDDLERDPVQPGERRQHPGGERVRVDDERKRGPHRILLTGQRSIRLGLQQHQLARESKQHAARLRRLDRLAATDEDASALLLERLHALADRRRRDAENSRRGLERPAVNNRGESAQVLDVG